MADKRDKIQRKRRAPSPNQGNATLSKRNKKHGIKVKTEPVSVAQFDDSFGLTGTSASQPIHHADLIDEIGSPKTEAEQLRERVIQLERALEDQREEAAKALSTANEALSMHVCKYKIQELMTAISQGVPVLQAVSEIDFDDLDSENIPHIVWWALVNSLEFFSESMTGLVEKLCECLDDIRPREGHGQIFDDGKIDKKLDALRSAVNVLGQLEHTNTFTNCAGFPVESTRDDTHYAFDEEFSEVVYDLKQATRSLASTLKAKGLMI